MLSLKEKEDLLDNALADVRAELIRSFKKHAPMHSAHEGHSVIREELDELWDHVKADTGQTRDALKEALQVAAMGLRYIVDLTPDYRLLPDDGLRSGYPAGTDPLDLHG